MKQDTRPLLEQLRDYGASDIVPLHMPGHKRNLTIAPYLEKLGGGMDITEVEGFDNLHAAEGVLKQAMERAAALWHSQRSFFLVNGSSGGLLAGIRAATKRGDRVLVARNCHKAVYHALEVCGLEPIFLLPPAVPKFGFFASLGVEQVAEALDENLDIRLVILTSPTYEGVVSDVTGICKIAHARNIPVLVDEAHGAHLGFHSAFSGGAVTAGADIIIQSLHKTLPSLTQTAIAHLNGTLISPWEMERQLGVFQTSSPSYLFMGCMDACVRLLETKGTELFIRWEKRLQEFDHAITGLQHLRVFGHGQEAGEKYPGVYGFDTSKLNILSPGNGKTLITQLREQFHIEMELSLEDYTVAMTGLGDAPDALPRLAEALLELDKKAISIPKTIRPLLPLPERLCPLDVAAQGDWQEVLAEQAVGRISAEHLWAYPPGIPLITPGEVLTAPLLIQHRHMGREGVNLLGTRCKPPETVAVLCE